MKNVKTLLNNVFENAENGTSSTILALPGSGRTYSLKKILGKREYPDNFGLVYINASELLTKTPDAFLNQFLIELATLKNELEGNGSEMPSDVIQALQVSNDTLSLSAIKRLIPKILDHAKYLLIIIDDVSKLKSLGPDFFNALRNIRFISKENIHFIFLDDIKAVKGISEEVFGQLYQYFQENLLYFPLPCKEGFDKIYESMSKEYLSKPTNKYKRSLWNNSHGHPGIIKYNLVAVNKKKGEPDPSELIKNKNLQTILDSIISNLNQKELDLIKENADPNDKLRETGLYKCQENSDYKYPLLLSEYIKKTGKKARKNNEDKKRGRIKLKGGVVSLDKKQIANPLTKREYKILEHFDKNRGKVIPREELGQVIWGENSSTEYSDWAIDQSISRLRKKLGDNAYKPTFLKTIRGRGFIFED